MHSAYRSRCVILFFWIVVVLLGVVRLAELYPEDEPFLNVDDNWSEYSAYTATLLSTATLFTFLVATPSC